MGSAAWFGRRAAVVVLRWYVLFGLAIAARDAHGACAGSANQLPAMPNATERLQALRQRMLAKGVSAYIIPGTDSHQRTAFIAPADRRIEFLTGFSGTAGAAVVLSNKAALWMEHHHLAAAEAVVDKNWIRMHENGGRSPELWIIDNCARFSRNFTVIANSELLSADVWHEYEQRFGSFGMRLVDDERLLDTLWESMSGALSRPPPTNKQLRLIDTKFSGRSWFDKVGDIQRELNGQANFLVATDLDDISWLFNLRGSDVDYSPVFFAYAIVPAVGPPRLYLRDFDRRLQQICGYLRCEVNGRCRERHGMCTEIYRYENVFADICSMSREATNISISTTSSYKVYAQVDQDKTIVELPLIQHFREMKNHIEVQGLRSGHLRDSAIIVELMARVEKDVQSNKSWSDMDVSRELETLRRKYDYYLGPGLPTFVGYGPDGAKIGHEPTCSANRNLSTDSLLVLATGGHYEDGTTAITRTFHFGTPQESEKSSYTRVLKQVVDQAMRKWPIARKPGQIRDAFGDSDWETDKPMYEGVLRTEDFGEFQDGEFGARLDSTRLTVKKNESAPEQAGEVYMGFEPLVFIPFEIKLIDESSLSRDQAKWINEYQEQCLEKVGSILLARNLTEARSWLLARTTKLTGVGCILNVRVYLVTVTAILQPVLGLWLH